MLFPYVFYIGESFLFSTEFRLELFGILRALFVIVFLPKRNVVYGKTAVVTLLLLRLFVLPDFGGDRLCPGIGIEIKTKIINIP